MSGPDSLAPAAATAACNPFTAPPLPLQTEPTNRTTPRLFVAATRMNDGKTTTCLGLYAAIRGMYPRVGFIKPVGQRFVEVRGQKIDEDSVLLDALFHVHVPIESMSPVAVDGTFTRRFLRDPEPMRAELEDRICRAFDRVSWEKDFTLIEGTGHAGVGSVFDLSNARVARLLGAKVLMVAAGGIGRPIDEIALNKALFDKEGVEVVGVVLNKVDADKTDQIADYAGRGLARLGVPLLGVLPRQTLLAAPHLGQIAAEIEGRWLNRPPGPGAPRIHQVVIAAGTADRLVQGLGPGTLLITPGDREDVIRAVLAMARRGGPSPVAGLVLTDGYEPHPDVAQHLAEVGVAAIAAAAPCFAVTHRIHDMTVKTLPGDTDKFPVIQDLIQNHVNLKALLRAL
jgi:BioD-like phosphotransacetylase family protein